MKILHVSDTHLGYSAYHKTTTDGINQREMDTYNSFEQFIDYSIKSKPDLIIHAGDLFDSVRPNNRAITVAIKQLLRLSKAKIPIVIIAGNHEHPKLKETGHIFSVFDHIENVYPIYTSKYQTKKFEIKGEKITVHAIPQCEIKKQFEGEIKKLIPEKNSDYNLFTTHGAVAGISEFSMNEFNELMIPEKIFSADFDYIALGHFHRFTKLGKNAFYCGSTERFTFTDAQDNKGFIEIDLSKEELKTKFVELKIRQMIDTKPIKCSNLKIEEIMNKIKNTVKEINPSEKTFRISLDEIPNQIYRSLDFEEIKKISSNAIHFELKVNVTKEDQLKKEGSSKIYALTNEFKDFIENQDVKEKETLLEMGLAYIEKVEAKKEGQ